jgi:acyl-CoA synthetase (AMP-forming)/AMP-acid ligase II
VEVPLIERRVAQVLEIDPTAEAVQENGRWYTWADITRMRRALASMLEAHAVGVGAQVGIVMRNRFASVAAELGLLCEQRCIVPLNPNFGDAKLIGELEHLGLPLLLAERRDLDRPGVLEAAAAAGTVCVELRPDVDPPVVAVDPVAHGRAGARPSATPMPGIAARMPTSGTTGTPKRITIGYDELDHMLFAQMHFKHADEPAVPVLRKGVAIMPAPIVHSSGFGGVLRAVADGRRIVLLERFEPEAWARVIEEIRPATASCVPAALAMILEAGIAPERLSSLQSITVGTAALDPALKEKFEAAYPVPLLEVYGATEFPGGIAGWNIDLYRRYHDEKLGSTGTAHPGVELQIRDQETGAVLGPDETGLLTIRTPVTPRHHDDGWVVTNDVASIDEDGFVFIKGRADDAIIRGGFKVLPQEIERVLLEHPAVKAAGVIGRPDERLGAVPVAAVELREPVTPEDLQAYARRHLASYQVPTQILVVDELPRTVSLKVSKPELRALLGA